MLGQLIKAERERRGWSQTELARRAGVSVALISQMEKDRRGRTADVVARVTTALEIDQSLVSRYLITGRPPQADQPRSLVDMAREFLVMAERLETERADLERQRRPKEDDVASVSRRISLPRAGVLQLA